MNLCTTCGEDFAGVSAFDEHRIGKHAYLFSEGLNMNPPKEDGRRCMDKDEMLAAGLQQNAQGRWFIESDARRLREHHARGVV